MKTNRKARQKNNLLIFALSSVVLMATQIPSAQLATTSKLSGEADISIICRLYNFSLRIILLTPLRSIASIPICVPPGNNATRENAIYIESLLHPIIAYDVDRANGYIIYLVDQIFQLRIVPLPDHTLTAQNSNQIERAAKFRTKISKLFNISLWPEYEHWSEKKNESRLEDNLLLATYASSGEGTPRLLALDYTHHLLYTVCDSSDIRVSSLVQANGTLRSIHLISRHEVTIQRIYVCVPLRILVWQEIEWNGRNRNTIQIAQQDGTQIRTIAQEDTFITDMVVEQREHALYYTASGANYLTRISLRDYYHQHNERLESSTWLATPRQQISLAKDVKHFAILNPYLIDIQHAARLAFHDLRRNVVTTTSMIASSSARWLVHNEFRLFTSFSQPSTEPMCPSSFNATDDAQTVCTDICLPNDYVARFTCFCYDEQAECPEYGHHHHQALSDNDERQNGEDFKQSTANVAQHNVSIVGQDTFSDEQFWNGTDQWWQENSFISTVHYSTTTATSIAQIDTRSSSSSAQAKHYQHHHHHHHDRTKSLNDSNYIALHINNVSETRSEKQQKSGEQSQFSTFRTILFLAMRILTSAHIGMATSTTMSALDDNSERLRQMDAWIETHQTSLTAAMLIALFASVVLVIFLLLYIGFTISKTLQITPKNKISKTISGASNRTTSSLDNKNGKLTEKVISINRLYTSPLEDFALAKSKIQVEIEVDKSAATFGSIPQDNLSAAKASILDTDNDEHLHSSSIEVMQPTKKAFAIVTSMADAKVSSSHSQSAISMCTMFENDWQMSSSSRPSLITTVLSQANDFAKSPNQYVQSATSSSSVCMSGTQKCATTYYL